MIVEDEPSLRDVYKLILAKHDYEVYVAPNGAEGLVLLNKHKPDMVLLDIFMPVMDGKEFMKNVDVNNFPDTKFVINSNLSDKDTEDEMLALGAHRFVLKASLAPQSLIKLIEDTVAS